MLIKTLFSLFDRTIKKKTVISRMHNTCIEVVLNQGARDH